MIIFFWDKVQLYNCRTSGELGTQEPLEPLHGGTLGTQNTDRGTIQFVHSVLVYCSPAGVQVGVYYQAFTRIRKDWSHIEMFR